MNRKQYMNVRYLLVESTSTYMMYTKVPVHFHCQTCSVELFFKQYFSRLLDICFRLIMINVVCEAHTAVLYKLYMLFDVWPGICSFFK